MAKNEKELNFKINNNIVLIEGIDKHFFNILLKLYKPFLSSSHFKDPIQFTIFHLKSIIGFIQIGKSPARFIQIALIPDAKGKGITKDVIFALTKKLEIEKIGWTADKSNYPSLKLLYDLGGELNTKSLDSKKKKAEGYLRIKKSKIDKESANLKSILSSSKEKFLIWHKEEFDKRKQEMITLHEYVQKL